MDKVTSFSSKADQRFWSKLCTKSMIQTLRNAGSRISGLKYYSKLIRNPPNHNYNKILKSDWLSTVLISVLKGRCNLLDSTRHHARALEWVFIFTSSKKSLRISCLLLLGKLKISQILLWLCLTGNRTELHVIQFGL